MFGELPNAEPVPEPDPRLAAVESALDMAGIMPGLEGAAIGFCLLDTDGRVLLDRNARTAQIPASTLKTLTTAAALDILGQGFRFETVLELAGSRGEDDPDGDRLDGDLILLGGGDPTLAVSDLAAWAAELAANGVRHVSGRIIGDGRLFDGSVFPDFWDWGGIGNGYGSPVSGLNLQHNRFAATFSSGEQQDEPAGLVRVQPEVPGVAWWNHVLTGAPGSGDGVMIYGGERATVMHLRGTVPPAGELTVRGAVPDPERFAAHHLREALVAAGSNGWLNGEPLVASPSRAAHRRSMPSLLRDRGPRPAGRTVPPTDPCQHNQGIRFLRDAGSSHDGVDDTDRGQEVAPQQLGEPSPVHRAAAVVPTEPLAPEPCHLPPQLAEHAPPFAGPKALLVRSRFSRTCHHSVHPRSTAATGIPGPGSPGWHWRRPSCLS